MAGTEGSTTRSDDTRAGRGTRERILEAAHDLVFERGFGATTLDAVLEVTGVSKGAFFHHFSSKAALGKALIERYARLDAEVLEDAMARAEAVTPDPAHQLIEFIRAFERDVEAGIIDQPGCLFASYLYEQIPEEVELKVVVERSIALWRDRVLEKLKAATEHRPLNVPVDLGSLADHVWSVFEGGFILARAMGDPLKLRDELSHLRTYLAMQLGVDPGG